MSNNLKKLKYKLKKENIINNIQDLIINKYNDYKLEIKNKIINNPYYNEIKNHEDYIFIIITGNYKSGKTTYIKYFQTIFNINKSYNIKKLSDLDNIILDKIMLIEINKNLLNKTKFFIFNYCYIFEIKNNFDNYKKKIVNSIYHNYNFEEIINFFKINNIDFKFNIIDTLITNDIFEILSNEYIDNLVNYLIEYDIPISNDYKNFKLHNIN